MDTKISTPSEFYIDEFETDYKNNLKSEVTYNKLLLPSFCLAK